MRQRTELKAALDALEVRKPLRLPSAAPTFTPPAPTPVEQTTEAANPTPVPDPTPVEKSIPVNSASPDVSATWVTNPTPAGDTTAVEKPTQVPLQTGVGTTPLVQKPTPVEKGTAVEIPTQVSDPSSPRRANEQDSSVQLDAQAVDKLERGYTRLPNAVLMKLVSGEFTRNEIKLALLIARFTISFQRQLAPLSKTVLARRSGLREPAVLEALSGLVAKGLVDKRQGDQNRPNLLGLILPEGWDKPTPASTPAEPQTGATPVAKATAVPIPTGDGISAPAEVRKPTGAGVENPTYFKDKERYLNKSSFSQLPENLRSYFEQLKPARKRESEWKAFQELQRDYVIEDIEDCLKHVQTKGIGSGESTQSCHSPMAFLSKAMGEILPTVEDGRRRLRERAEREQREATAAAQRREEETREAAEWAEKERAFVRAFPEEDRQREVLAELLQDLPFRSHSQAGRIMAIGRWWDGLNPTERQVLIDK